MHRGTAGKNVKARTRLPIWLSVSIGPASQVGIRPGTAKFVTPLGPKVLPGPIYTTRMEEGVLMGNIPVIDVLRLSDNEGITYSEELKLLSAA
jgi:hypothetical protein